MAGTPIQIEGFEILEKLGTGGMATVWKARQLSLDRIVAIKVLASRLASDPADVERFQKEAQAAARLKHPGIVQVYDANAQGHTYYFVMEYIDGYTVGDWIERKGRVPVDDALLVAECVAGALSYAWQQAQIIHCDIKPDNVMVDADGTVKVADLGLARTLSAMAAQDETDDVMGTPNYMSPEQARGDGDLDCRTDIYALGAMLYQLLSGNMLFEGMDDEAVVQNQISDRVPDPMDLDPNTPRAVCWLIEKMLAKDREYRQPDWDAVLADIARVKRGRLPAGRKLPEGVSTMKRSKRRVHHEPVYPADMRRANHAEVVTPGAKVLLGVFFAVLAVGAVLMCLPMFRHRPPPPMPPRLRDRPHTPTHATNAAVPDAGARSKDAQAGEMFDFASRWAAEHADQFDACIAHFSRVAEDTRGTKYSLMAENEIARIRKARQAAIDGVLKELEKKAADHIAAKEYEQAAQIFEGYVGQRAELTRSLRMERAAQLRTQHDQQQHARDEQRAVAAAKAGSVLDKVAEELVKGGLANGLNCLVEHSAGTDESELAPAVAEVGAIMRKACGVHDAVLKSFEEQVGRRIYVDLADGRHRLTVERVVDNRIEAREKTDIGYAERTFSFSLQDLASRELLQRMGSDDEPYVCLAKGLMALTSQALAVARTYFEKTGPELAPRLTAQLDRLEQAAQQDAAEKELRRLLTTFSITMAGAYDPVAWAQDLQGRTIAPLTRQRLKDALDRLQAKYAGMPFGAGVTTLIDAINPPEPGNFVPVDEDFLPDSEDGAGGDGTLGDAAVAQRHKVFQLLQTDNPGMTESQVEVLLDADEHVTGISLHSPQIESVKALGALSSLTSFECVNEGKDARRIDGLSALEKNRLRRLVIENCKFNDLTPFAAMPLRWLSVRGTDVRDLAPLRDTMLEFLDISGTRVADVTPIAGIPLVQLMMNDLPIRSISFVKNMPLERLGLANTRIADYSPMLELQDLAWVDLSGTPLRNLSYLSNKPVETLLLANSRVSDISELPATRLNTLSLAGCTVDSYEPLAGVPIRNLDVSGTDFFDMSVIAEMPLQRLNIRGTGVRDLTVLEGKDLEFLNIEDTAVSDIRALKGMPLVELKCRGTRVVDYAPLMKAPIKRLWIDVKNCPDDVLSSMPNLTTVNGTRRKLGNMPGPGR